MARHIFGSLLAIATLGVSCAQEPPANISDERPTLRLGAVNLGLNANQPDVRERQDLYLATKPGTGHSFLVDATKDFDILCTNEMYTWSREDSYVALVNDLNAVFPFQMKGADSSDLSGCGCTEQAWNDYLEPFKECVEENPQRDLLTCFNAPMTVMGHRDPEWSAWRCTRCLTATVLKTDIDYTLPLDAQREILDDIDFTPCRRDPEPIQCPN